MDERKEIDMEADIKWLDQPEVFRVNQIPAHSDHRFYGNREECSNDKSSLKQCLNGVWEFYYSENAKKRPNDFYKEDYDYSGFDKIEVPKHIELAGYDKLHYINTMYPWEGHIFRRPAYSLPGWDGKGMFSEADYNPVGSYIKIFDLDETMRGKRIYISFEGVEQAMYVWLNGVFIGYAEDSFTPSEFDLTDAIKEKGNRLAVEVHKRSTAAFLEDQDFFRFFGIFRDVNLYAKPEVHIEDLWVRPEVSLEDRKGKLKIALKNSAVKEFGEVKICLRDGNHSCLEASTPMQEQMQLCYEIPESVILWDNHNPYLYELELEVYNKHGKLIEIVPYQVGFRKIEIREKVIYLNGKRLIINGVNRHEWSAQNGRSISDSEQQWDMECIKRNHMNAVRTCHYPDRTDWYYLCDKEGIYVMAETNLETHGSWQKWGKVDPSWNVPGSIKAWEAVVLGRARTNFEVLKNHTSILFWSLGNESYAGEGLKKMNQFFKETDPSRLVHYEGVFHNRTYEDCISDIESRMYATPEQIVTYLEQNPKKPFILCEYMHDMGNSLGGMKSYIQLLDRYEMYQGGFIWDFIDQALWVVDEVTGEKVLRYGGDFDDRPSDYEFSANGIVFADRTEKPAMQEVSYYYGKYN